MAKWKQDKPKEYSGGSKQVTLDIPSGDYAELERLIRAPDSVFKTVENYLLFMIQNRVKKVRGIF